VRSPPERVDEAVITTALAAGWGLSIVVLRDVPLGAGAYQKGRPPVPAPRLQRATATAPHQPCTGSSGR
jgi:hypothetical protein